MASPEPTTPIQPFPPAPDSFTPSPPEGPSGRQSARQSINSGRASSPPGSTASTRQKTRGNSISQSFLNSNLPFGMWQATGEIASKVPTISEIRKGSFSVNGWTEEGQMEQRGHTPHQITRRQSARYESRQRKSSASSKLPELPEGLARQQTDESRVPPPIFEDKTLSIDG